MTSRREQDLVASTFVEQMRGWRKVAARLVRLDGAYLRFVGELTIQRWSGSTLVESSTDEAIRELMYFGHARADDEGPVRPV